jgi:hypothetical protein
MKTRIGLAAALLLALTHAQAADLAVLSGNGAKAGPIPSTNATKMKSRYRGKVPGGWRSAVVAVVDACRFGGFMRLQPIRRRGVYLVAVLVLSACCGLAAVAENAKTASPAAEPSAAAITEYRLKLEEYLEARQKYDAKAAAYWRSVKEKRDGRRAKRRTNQEIALSDYVLTQPPVYAGPPEPLNPEKAAPEALPPRKYVPVVADFLQAAAEQFKFMPDMPKSEIEFKRAYAKVASRAGLTKEQVVRIYGFESGGDGHYDVQAGLEYPTAGARAISTALGYNQLLNTNSVELLAEQGESFIKALKAKVATLRGTRKKLIEKKIGLLQRMIDIAKSVPDEWSEHEKLANTRQGLAIHALNLDIDVGPLLQTQKLLDSVVFARKRGYMKPLTAAELEMMNLTGDGNGFDMVTMLAEFREKVPTANFFQPDGYEANSVAIVNNTVAVLIKATDAKMDQEIQLQGAKDLAAAF